MAPTNHGYRSILQSLDLNTISDRQPATAAIKLFLYKTVNGRIDCHGLSMLLNFNIPLASSQISAAATASPVFPHCQRYDQSNYVDSEYVPIS